LENILEEIELGLIGSITAQVQAELFDDFLEHGEHYLDAGRTNEGGVIAAIVFEDTLRRPARKHQITEKDRPLDQVISDLVKLKALTGLEAKKSRVYAEVRAKVAHAQWDEVKESDVREVIGFLNSSLLPKLSA
jgi:hypothetical protein